MPPQKKVTSVKVIASPSRYPPQITQPPEKKKNNCFKEPEGGVPKKPRKKPHNLGLGAGGI